MCYAALIISEVYHLLQLQKLKEVESNAVKLIDISEVWPENEGKLVFLQGFMKIDRQLITDDLFGVQAKAPILIREAEMYQWVE